MEEITDHNYSSSLSHNIGHHCAIISVIIVPLCRINRFGLFSFLSFIETTLIARFEGNVEWGSVVRMLRETGTLRLAWGCLAPSVFGPGEYVRRRISSLGP